MAYTALYFLLATTAVAAVQVGFVPPATSYVYNKGPAGYVSYHQAHNAFEAPLPIPAPVKPLEAYDLAPVPLPYVAAKPIVVEGSEDDDDSDESSEEYHDGGLGYFAKGGGSDYGEEYRFDSGEKGGKGYKSEDHHAKGKSGKYGKEHHEGFYDEAKGGKKGHHDEAAAHGKHYEAGESYKGGDHGHKQQFSKGEDISGYHKIFHKDEYKKDHDFYDVADNKGHFSKHGFEEAHHGSEYGGHNKGGQNDAAFNKGGFGKGGFNARGHVDDSDHGHSAEEGLEKYYHDEAEYGKKGGSSHEKGYAFGDDGDEDDEDDDHE